MCVMFCVILCAMHVCNVSPFEEKGIGCYVLPDTPYVCMCDYSLGRARLHHGTTCEHCVTYVCVCVYSLSTFGRGGALLYILVLVLSGEYTSRVETCSTS